MPISHLINDFEALSLKELDKVALIKRYDTKFILSVHQLQFLLSNIFADYQILEITGKRVFDYFTVYFDTPNFQFYLDHHNGYTHRMKVRKREYLNTGMKFYEVKKKLAGQQTDKARWGIQQMNENLSTEEYKKVNYPKLEGKPLEKKLVNTFSRITLANIAFNERVTIDFNIQLNAEAKSVNLSQLVILELKQPKFNVLSPIVQQLKKMRIYPSSFSKYVMGVVLLDLHPKKNLFKPQILKVKDYQPIYS